MERLLSTWYPHLSVDSLKHVSGSLKICVSVCLGFDIGLSLTSFKLDLMSLKYWRCTKNLHMDIIIFQQYYQRPHVLVWSLAHEVMANTAPQYNNNKHHILNNIKVISKQYNRIMFHDECLFYSFPWHCHMNTLLNTNNPMDSSLPLYYMTENMMIMVIEINALKAMQCYR
jgi:hypothetical protein